MQQKATEVRLEWFRLLLLCCHTRTHAGPVCGRAKVQILFCFAC